MIKRNICMILIICTIASCFVPQKVYAGEVAVAELGWDVIATLIVILAGKEIDDVLTNNESEWAIPSVWEQDAMMTQEKLDFVNLHQSVSEWKMRDDVAQEFWRNVNQKEFDELKNLYNSKRNPDFYTGDGLNLAINLNIFKGIFKHFRDRKKSSIVAPEINNDTERKIVFKSTWEGKEFTSYNYRDKSTDKRYAIYKQFYPAVPDRFWCGVMYRTEYQGQVSAIYADVYVKGVQGSPGIIYADITKPLFTDGPVFNTKEACEDYLINGNIDNAINKEMYANDDYIPSNFMPNTKTVLPNEINEIDELKHWITDLITPVMPSTQVIKIIGGEEVPATGIYDLDSDSEDGKYFTIIGDIINWLQKIYNFIISIPGLIIEWLKKIYDFLVGFPEAIINGIKNILEWLFVPDTVTLLPMVDLLRDKINNSISVATYPLKIILNLFDKLTNLSASDCILIFPEINFMGKKLNDEYVFNFTQFLRRDEYKRIYKLYRSFTSFIIILAVLTTALRKFNENLKG